MRWEDKPQVQKGMVGEAIVMDWLRQKGFIPYTTAADCPHPFDYLCASKDKKTIFVADAKSKPARTRYPDTGIDIRHHAQYLHIRNRYKLHVFLFFVDEDAGKIYGNFLDVLNKPRMVKHNGAVLRYPLNAGGIRYWPLSAMRPIGKLTDEQIATLRELSTRAPAYAPPPEQPHG